MNTARRHAWPTEPSLKPMECLNGCGVTRQLYSSGRWFYQAPGTPGCLRAREYPCAPAEPTATEDTSTSELDRALLDGIAKLASARAEWCSDEVSHSTESETAAQLRMLAAIDALIATVEKNHRARREAPAFVEPRKCPYCVKGVGVVGHENSGDGNVYGPCNDCGGTGRARKPEAGENVGKFAPGPGSGTTRYYLVSLSRSRQAHTAATFWGPDARGYTLDVDKAGRFTDREVAKYATIDSITIECGAVQAVAMSNMLNTRHLDALTSGAVIVGSGS